MNAIDLKLNDIYLGKATMIKDNKYFSTRQYVEPFIDRVDKLCQGNFIIKAQPANQISLTPQGDVNMEDIVFNRVWIQGVLPGEYAYENHQQSINMLYALDTRKPLVKLFKSAINQACLNMTVFDFQLLQVQPLLPEQAIDYTFIDIVENYKDTIKSKLDQLNKLIYTKFEIQELLGIWIDKLIKTKFQTEFGSVKLSETIPIEVYKKLFIDSKSRYYCGEHSTNGFNVYNAFTDIISNDSNKDIINKYEKVLIASSLFDLK